MLIADTSYEVLGWWADILFRKRRLLRFCLGISRTSQLFETIAKDKATVDVYGVCYISLVHLCAN